jgi:plasmid stabilization system protein ParE
MAYRIERSIRAIKDLHAIFEFLYDSAIGFGESPEGAVARAEKRLRKIEAALHALAKAPHQGTLRSDLLPGLRSVTKERAIFYFITDDEEQAIRVLAIFFGAQDHQRAMVLRILSEK